jgi:hypothetical protein
MRKDSTDRGVGCQPRVDSIRATAREKGWPCLSPSELTGDGELGTVEKVRRSNIYRGSNLASLKSTRACTVRFPRQVSST